MEWGGERESAREGDGLIAGASPTTSTSTDPPIDAIEVFFSLSFSLAKTALLLFFHAEASEIMIPCLIGVAREKRRQRPKGAR